VEHERTRHMGQSLPSKDFLEGSRYRWIFQRKWPINGQETRQRFYGFNPDHFPMNDDYEPFLFNYKWSDEKTISDVLGRESGFNPCYHFQNFPIKASFSPGNRDKLMPMELLDHYWRKSGVEFSGSGQVDYSVDTHFGEQAFVPQYDRAVDWNSLVLGAGAVLDGHMAAKSNIFSVLGELAQTYKMVRNPFGLLKANWRRSNLTLRQIVKSGANVWLEQKYGWQNFFRDMTNIGRMLEKSRQHVNYLLRTKSQWASVQKTQTDEVPCPVPNSVIGYPANYLQGELSNVWAKRTATFSLHVLRGEAFNVLTQHEYFLQGIGADRLNEALWDLTPFSFVVDWFIDIQKLISVSPVNWQKYNLRKLGYSVKEEVYADLELSSTFYLQLPSIGETVEFAQKYHNQLVRKSYMRSEGFPPNSATAGIFGSLNLDREATSGALVAQRIL